MDAYQTNVNKIYREDETSTKQNLKKQKEYGKQENKQETSVIYNKTESHPLSHTLGIIGLSQLNPMLGM